MSGWHLAVCVCVCVCLCVLGHAAAICFAQAFENTVDLAGLFAHEVANDRLLLPTQAQMCKVPRGKHTTSRCQAGNKQVTSRQQAGDLSR